MSEHEANHPWLLCTPVLKWYGAEIEPERPHADPFLGVIERYDTWHKEAPTSLQYELISWEGKWRFYHGRPEEGDGRRLVRWCRLPRVEGGK